MFTNKHAGEKFETVTKFPFNEHKHRQSQDSHKLATITQIENKIKTNTNISLKGNDKQVFGLILSDASNSFFTVQSFAKLES
jgi:hypothetical protein